MSPIKGTQSRTGGKLIRGGRTGDVTSEIDGTATEISGRREDNLTTLLAVSGGTKIESGNDRYHVFTSPGTFTTGVELTSEVLVVGGGGSGGGTSYSGGGGAGGVLHAPSTTIRKGRYSVTVGERSQRTGRNEFVDGNDSSFGDAVAKGGGGGSGYQNRPANRPGSPIDGTQSAKGRSGGSCGGSGSVRFDNDGNPVGSLTPDPKLTNPAPSDYTGYGNLGGGGGTTPADGWAGGGGGGAGAVGGTTGTNSAQGGDGGAGRAFPGFPAPVIAPAIPAPVRPGWTPVVGPTGLFAGGGGGGNYYTNPPTTGSSGGTGGGGAGTPGTSIYADGTSAVRFTGSGGGGTNYPYSDSNGNSNAYGGRGGDGIVIVKYSVA